MPDSRRTPILFSVVAAVCVLVGVSRADAEIIFFANGRSLSVKDYRVDGNLVTVTLQGGGEATFDRAMIARVAPSEVIDAPEPAPPPDNSSTGDVRSNSAALTSRPFSTLIDSVALEHGVPAALVHAVVQAESNYQPRARSDAGARGLMQVMPATGAGLGVRNLYDPQNNLRAGVQYLKLLLAEFTLPEAIAAYNAGPAAVRRYQGIPPFPETQEYVKKVLADLQQ